MEIIFNCPNCDQELSVDAEGAGSEIKCPTCGDKIVIPEKPAATSAPPPPPPADGDAAQPVNPIASSAAAKIEMHLKVPVRDKPSELLVKKTAVVGIAAKGAVRKVRIRTIRHASCIESGHDKFDDRVSEFLNEVGEANIVSVHTITYEHFDVGLQKILVDFGVLVVFRG
jgi:DNA-directed RNA polymerase subunit RPC12/RpoP